MSSDKTSSILDDVRSTIASLDQLRRVAPCAPVASQNQNASNVSQNLDETRGETTVPILPNDLGSPNSDSSLSGECEKTHPVTPVKATISPITTSTPAHRRIVADARIMIVDDEPLNLRTFEQLLRHEGYENFLTTDQSDEALTLIRKHMPDLLLLDIHMPGVSGLDILRVVGLDPSLQHIPVLILTADTDPKLRKTALDLGATDFLSKPVDTSELIPRVRNSIVLKRHFDMVANERSRLDQLVEHRTRQLEATRQQLILSLARAAEHRDNDTGNHVIRVGKYTTIIAQAMGYPAKELTMLEQAAQLHDVGKIGIPDSILFNTNKLSEEEFRIMKHHCVMGKQIIEPFSEHDFEILKTHTMRGQNLLNVSSSPLLALAACIAQTHHEKWDGTGYPLGLKGTDIPIEGRMVAVADVYDALSSERPYKKPFSREKCFAILEEGRGQHFDPDVLDAFFSNSDQIVETQLKFIDAVQAPMHKQQNFGPVASTTEN